MTIRVSKKMPVGTVKKANTRGGTIYQPVLDQMASLKANQSFLVDIPRGVPAGTFQNRLTATFKRYPVTPPKGCCFRKFTTDTNKICIACLPDGSGARRKKKTTKKKRTTRRKRG